MRFSRTGLFKGPRLRKGRRRSGIRAWAGSLGDSWFEDADGVEHLKEASPAVTVSLAPTPECPAQVPDDAVVELAQSCAVADDTVVTLISRISRMGIVRGSEAGIYIVREAEMGEDIGKDIGQRGDVPKFLTGGTDAGQGDLGAVERLEAATTGGLTGGTGGLALVETFERLAEFGQRGANSGGDQGQEPQGEGQEIGQASNLVIARDPEGLDTQRPILEVVELPLDGLITTDRFCFTRHGRLVLSWWRRPLRLRPDTLLAQDQLQPGADSGTELVYSATDSGALEWAETVGSGLPTSPAMDDGIQPGGDVCA